MAIAVGIGASAVIHPEYSHTLLFIYEFWPMSLVVLLTVGIIVRLFWGEWGSLLFHGLPLVAMLLIGIIVVFTLSYSGYTGARDRYIWDRTTPNNTTLTLVVPSATAIRDAPPPDVSLLRKNFVGSNDAGWSFDFHEEHLVVVPKIGLRARFQGIIPLVIPTWAGDFLVHADGHVEDLTAEQALQDPRLQSVPIYPPDLVVSLWSSYKSVVSAIPHPISQPRPILLETATSWYWAIPIDFNDQEQFSRFLAVDAHTGKVYFAHFRLQAAADHVVPIYSDGAWQPDQFLIFESPGQARFVFAWPSYQ